MIGTRGSTPHDLFDDFFEELDQKYKEDRSKIHKMAKAKGLVITSTSTYEWFHEQLKDEEGYTGIPEEHRTGVFESLVQKAKEQDQDVEKSAKKNRKRFVELLQKTREVTARTTYEQANGLLGSNSAWSAVDEQTRKQCFDIFVGQLKIQSESKNDAGGDDDDEDGDDDEDDGRRRKDNGKKKKRKDEPEEEEKPKKKVAKKKDREPEEDVEDEPEPPKKHRKKK